MPSSTPASNDTGDRTSFRQLFYTGTSMNGTFRNGDCLKVESITIDDIHRGDVIVYRDVVDSPAHRPRHIVHRAMKFVHGGIVMRGDNAPGYDIQLVPPANIVGRVTHLERSDKVRLVQNGHIGLLRGKVLHARRAIRQWTWRRIVSIGGRPYRRLKKTGLPQRLWKPTIVKATFQTEQGSLIKYISRGHTVAWWWPEIGKFRVSRPYDLVITAPDQVVAHFTNSIPRRLESEEPLNSGTASLHQAVSRERVQPYLKSPIRGICMPNPKANVSQSLNRIDFAKEILSLSSRFSHNVPPIKPFIRFSPELPSSLARRWWDFDNLVDKRLLELVRGLLTPDELLAACIDQWKTNLLGLSTWADTLAERGDTLDIPQFDRPNPRSTLLKKYLGNNDRVLYIGAGVGTECFQLAHQGFVVVGIDTVVQLVQAARNLSITLNRPAIFACMDAQNLGFMPGSFDAFLLEIYSYLPLALTIPVLQQLAAVLKPGGYGFMAAVRKHYSSFWHRMGSPFPKKMTLWLRQQAQLDFIYDQRDGSEERLEYGLYSRSDTVETLKARLIPTFDVVECFFDSDPRYLFAAVQPRKTNTPKLHQQLSAPSLDPDINSVLVKVTALREICDLLETHTAHLAACFSRPNISPSTCFAAAKPDLARLVELLETMCLDLDC